MLTPVGRREEPDVDPHGPRADPVDGLGAGAGQPANTRDRLIALGTSADDVLEVAATTGSVTLRDPRSAHVHLPLNTLNVEAVTLEGLGGDDSFVVNTPQPYTEVAVNGDGGAGGGERLGVLGAVGVAQAFTVSSGLVPGEGRVGVDTLGIPYRGLGHLFLGDLIPNGGSQTDSLVIYDDFADNTWNVGGGRVGDLVQIDAREAIDITGFNTVELVNRGGTDHFRVAPTNMTYSFITSFTVTGDGATANAPADDVLELVGTPAVDHVTSTANAVTVNGVTITVGTPLAGPATLAEIQVNTLAGDDSITLALGLTGVRKVVDAGAGNDTVNVSTMADATIYGGIGDDSITGSPLADLIYGGSGNDVIVSLAGDDTVYGDEGDDTITGGTGNDNLFGGDGSDRFIWNNGDNSDVVEGDEGVDVQVVNGSTGAAGDAFVLRTKTGDQTRAFFERTNLVPFTIDMGKVEQVDINSLAGGDTIEVRDLFTTDVRQVNVDVGACRPETDAVTVQGRTVADGVALTALAGGVVNIAGLVYDVNVASLDSPSDADTLTFNANEGDDLVFASDGLNAIFGTTLANVNHLVINGGEGNDSLTGFGQLNGNAGDDMLVGGAYAQTINGGDGADQLYGGGGDDALNGGAGEDLFVGGAGNDTINGGDTAGNIEWDTILVSGTSGNDTIDVNQTLPTSVTHKVNADSQTDTLGLLADGTRTVDEIRVEAGSGADLIRVRIADAAVGSMATDGVYNALVTVVHGGSATAAGDRLVMIDDGADDLTIYRKSQDDTAGTVSIGPANAESFETVFDGIERVQFLDETGAAVNANPGHSQPAGGLQARSVRVQRRPLRGHAPGRRRRDQRRSDDRSGCAAQSVRRRPEHPRRRGLVPGRGRGDRHAGPAGVL